jgi:hypothetical protein
LHADRGDVRAEPLRKTLTQEPATAADIDRFYGARPNATLRAIVVKLDGEPMGVIGLAREGGATRFFSEHRPEFEPYLGSVTAWRAVVRVMGWIKQSGGPVYSIAQHDEGARLLARLGFSHLTGTVWQH